MTYVGTACVTQSTCPFKYMLSAVASDLTARASTTSSRTRPASQKCGFLTIRIRSRRRRNSILNAPLLTMCSGLGQFGTPNWTKPEHIVSNGAFKIEFRRLRDRIRMVKNPHFWDAGRVRLDVVDALAVKSEATALNMYLKGQVDWVTQAVPTYVIPQLRKRDDYIHAPML